MNIECSRNSTDSQSPFFARVSVCVREPLLSAIDVVLFANGLWRKRSPLLRAILLHHFNASVTQPVRGRSIDLNTLGLPFGAVTSVDIRSIREANRNMVRRIILRRAEAGRSPTALSIDVSMPRNLMPNLERVAADGEAPRRLSVMVRETTEAWFEERLPGLLAAMAAGQEEEWLRRVDDGNEKPVPPESGDMVRAWVTFDGVVQPAARTALRTLRFRRAQCGWSGWIARAKIADAQASFSDHGGRLRLDL
ncbi:hypothetical protein [Roseomonas genomospecies 6]|uniref:Uncharacterized protein n=1 Tax=Roseomonas genomospecies 6 TaxID=214106 RepID=A0A9W7TYS7_9PROT|nr:hypothetical protein [Roseomonas genomospecies 6]KAA0680345.1 hypothetical protein DS843_13610 [Roseomonas genomospecies 6]